MSENRFEELVARQRRLAAWRTESEAACREFSDELCDALDAVWSALTERDVGVLLVALEAAYAEAGNTAELAESEAELEDARFEASRLAVELEDAASAISGAYEQARLAVEQVGQL